MNIPKGEELLRAFGERMAASGPKYLEEEYLSLRELDLVPDRNHVFATALLPVNASRNRYSNILANEATRVQLSNGTYINGNVVLREVFGVPYMYIMTQAPLLSTVNEFWQMVWEQKVAVIVQLNQDNEHGWSGQAKGYVPSLPPEGLLYGPLHVRITKKEEFSECSTIKREMLLTRSGTESVRIQHFQFFGWPDHGVPPSCEGVIKLMAMVECYAPPSQPLLVHCSAGVGRTGTFMSTHIASQLARQGRLLPAPDTASTSFSLHGIVEALKATRTGTVQGKDQYQFIYRAVILWLQQQVAGR